ncbi:MAG: hypothetical protein IK057_00310 [Clostridia bacterium]|nr:hypothetical protein [Clostridia bacterium]
MKTVFLSIRALIYGYFCDICLKICRKNTENRLKRGKKLSQKPTVFLGRFCEKRLSKWQKLEKELIFRLFEA